MRAKHSLEFARAPAIWPMYPRILLVRKPALVPEGGAVPRIEARIRDVTVDPAHLARYARICAAESGAFLPIAYPHVLAMPLHLAMLGAEAFPVKLLGLVHLQNRIVMRQPVPAEERAEIRAWIEGHRDTERGQEFELHTEYLVAGESLWEEQCVFLARRRGAGARPVVARGADVPEGVATSTITMQAPAGLGRRYGFVSGDVNPIHMSNLTARAFGFPRAIAHGMWSLARIASEFGPALLEGGCDYSVSFRMPVFMPSELTLVRWEIPQGAGFLLRGAGEKPHVVGAVTSL